MILKSFQINYFLTRSRQEPPPRYSMMIHSLVPRRKLPRYCVTYGLAHVAKTAISCWISWMSSSLDSRSIWRMKTINRRNRARTKRIFPTDQNNQESRPNKRTCFTATISPVALSMALYTVPKLPPNRRKSQHLQLANFNKQGFPAQLTSQLLHHLILTRHICRHCTIRL